MRNRCKGMTVILSFIFFIPISLFGAVWADEWVQTTQPDFESGTQTNVDTISDPGNVTLSQVWNKIPSTYVLDLGPPGSWEDFYVWAPRVVYDGSTYHMWYSGDDGHNGRIGYASSTDRITWTKYSGNPVLDCGPSGSWEGSVYVPSVVYDGSIYHMWYTGYNLAGTYRIGYAYSADGLSWTRYSDNPVLDIGPYGSWDDEQVHATTVLFDGSTYHMWYSGYDGSTQKIGYATSSDGIVWTKNVLNPVLDVGPPGSWDDTHVYYPTVVYNDTTSTYHMWYIGRDGITRRIGYATSKDGISWTKYLDNPVLDIGPAGAWDDDYLHILDVIYCESNYHMWYTGADGANFRIGYATLGYVPSGNLISSVFDSGANKTTWNFINWTEYLPLGTNITMSTRTGDTPKPDSSWSSWSREMWDETGSTITSPKSRYIQYRATLFTTNKYLTPILMEVNINYSLEIVQPPPNQLPIANAGSNQTVDEGDIVQFDGSASYDLDGTIASYEWDFDLNNGLWWETHSDPDAVGPNATHTYGDNGVFIVTLRVIDDQNASAEDTYNITVNNVDPTAEILSVSMKAKIGLRVAGRKYNNVSMALYEEGNKIGQVSIERLPGSPNEQMAWIPYILDMTKTYSANVTYEPKDPPDIGGNPVWIYIKFANGNTKKIHHTFNVQQSKKRDSHHPNHVEPWEVDLNAHLFGCHFELTYYVIDPGSDDETLTFTYGSQNKIVTHLNNPPNPDPYPSPEVNPSDILDTTTLTYEGPENLMLLVEDDDGGADVAFLELK